MQRGIEWGKVQWSKTDTLIKLTVAKSHPLFHIHISHPYFESTNRYAWKVYMMSSKRKSTALDLYFYYKNNTKVFEDSEF